MAKVRPPQPDWRADTNPDALLNVVWPRPLAYDAATVTRRLPPAAVRRLRLYGVACARMVWDVLSSDARNAVLLSERYATGRATMADLRAAAIRRRDGPATFQHQAANAAAWASAGYRAQPPEDPDEDLQWNPAEAAREAAKALATRAAGPAPPGGNPVAKEWQVAWNRAYSDARAQQAELLRDIFPPPGYVPALHPDWRTSTVVILARHMDDTGEYSALPILADALQDAGCADEVVLGRCRAPARVRGRGNWVVDLVLGRE